jgi:Family of unknown function (DUF6263)
MHGREKWWNRLTALVCLALVSGCGWWNSQVDEGDEDPVQVSDDSARGTSGAAKSVTPQQTLELHLKPGDRFPLRKTVEHTLRQPVGQDWSTSHSNLDLLLSVTVTEIRPAGVQGAKPDPRAGQKRLQVQYHRIRFSQEVAGQNKIQYDSDAPQRPIPLPALGYHGLKDNGFEFWLSADNQFVEIANVEQFVERCLRDVPPARQQQVRAAMAATSGSDGISNFVDDSIGLLPVTAVREGDVWSRDRQVFQPVPMYLRNRYVLRRITDEIAEIDIAGTVSPTIAYGPSSQPNRDLNISVRGGNSVGSCLLDRRTGLPMQSRVEQSLDMVVRLADGSEFDQYKSTLTTIKYFPGQEGTPISPGSVPAGSTGTVVHADAEVPSAQPDQGTGPAARVGVTPAGGETESSRSGADPRR